MKQENLLETILEQNRRWASRKEEADPNYFKNLTRGQSPSLLYIGCSDSRVIPEEFMGLRAGEAFVHRNIANQVFPDDPNILTVIRYALGTLKIPHIVVCGHSGCGGIQVAGDPSVNLPWLRTIRRLRKEYQEKHRAEPEALSENRLTEKLTELNVLAQCKNLSLIPEVQSALKQKVLSLHAGVFEIETGRIKVLNPDAVL